jgi:hypothetical protein
MRASSRTWTVAARPGTLPVQLTSLVGREQEITQLSGLLERARLVTLGGPGGSARPGWPWRCRAAGGRFDAGVVFVPWPG